MLRVSSPARLALIALCIHEGSIPAPARAIGKHFRSSARVLLAFFVFILSYVRWNFPEVTHRVIAQQIDCRIRLKYSFLPKYIFV